MQSMSNEEQVDVVIMGMGPGGEDLGNELASAGMSVTGIDSRLLGGECPFWGCVPSKMMIRAADLLGEARRVPQMAGRVTVEPNWTPVAERLMEVTKDWDDSEHVERFVGRGGNFVRGHAKLVEPYCVEVDGRRFRARRGVVIATGTEPLIPPIDGLEGLPYWTNREAIETKEVPQSLIVVGGGAIGSELAQVFARFGSRVTVVESADRLLSSNEPEAGKILREVFEREGITVHTGVGARRVDHDGTFRVTLDGGETIEADKLLIATGRKANLSNIGLEVLGLDPEEKSLKVDEHLRVAEGVWALGDITGKGQFTHVAVYQAHIAAADISGRPGGPADYRAIPSVSFTDPEVGQVGMTESRAREEGLDVVVGSTPVPETARGWMHKVGNDGFIKLVADRGEGVLVGATSMGPNGGEVLGLLTLAVHARVPLDTLRSMVYAYPTFHRGVEDALRDVDL